MECTWHLFEEKHPIFNAELFTITVFPDGRTLDVFHHELRTPGACWVLLARCDAAQSRRREHQGAMVVGKAAHDPAVGPYPPPPPTVPAYVLVAAGPVCLSAACLGSVERLFSGGERLSGSYHVGFDTGRADDLGIDAGAGFLYG